MDSEVVEEAGHPQIELAIIDADSICYRAAAGAGDDSPVEHALHNAKSTIDKIFELVLSFAS